MFVAVIGVILIMALQHTTQWARYALLFPIVCGIYTTYCITYTWLSSTIVRPPEKRAAAIGIANTCANSAVLFGSYMWLDKYSPSYTVSWGCILAFGVTSASFTTSRLHSRPLPLVLRSSSRLGRPSSTKPRQRRVMSSCNSHRAFSTTLSPTRRPACRPPV